LKFNKQSIFSKHSNELTEQNIKSQHIGKMLDDLFDEAGKRKINLKTRLNWKWYSIKEI